jgi:hypothetical protein
MLASEFMERPHTREACVHRNATLEITVPDRNRFFFSSTRMMTATGPEISFRATGMSFVPE